MSFRKSFIQRFSSLLSLFLSSFFFFFFHFNWGLTPKEADVYCNTWYICIEVQLWRITLLYFTLNTFSLAWLDDKIKWIDIIQSVNDTHNSVVNLTIYETHSVCELSIQSKTSHLCWSLVGRAVDCGWLIHSRKQRCW